MVQANEKISGFEAAGTPKNGFSITNNLLVGLVVKIFSNKSSRKGQVRIQMPDEGATSGYCYRNVFPDQKL